MNVAASGRTWEDASSPAALRLTRKYEEAWHQAVRGGRRIEPGAFLAALEAGGEVSGARLAVLRADLALRWEAGDRVGARWYLDRFPDLGEDTLVALIYEEFCLREDEGEEPEPAEFLIRFAALAEPLKRVLDIHQLIGSTTASRSILLAESGSSGSRTQSPISPGSGSQGPFPEAGQTIGGFLLVEELGRGAFGRVFLARERQLADRPVALKVARKGSREPQALARLQHTHIVPVHSHRIDPATGLHLMCMPYFGRITLSRVLAQVNREDRELTGSYLVEVLDRLGDATEESPSASRSAWREELNRRSFAQAIAWWGARLAEALAHAHDRGILHRDIKPSNVLVFEDGRPMLLDFNLARESVFDDQGAGEATMGGTVDYMAPEHLEALAEGSSDRVDLRSDLFGLGVLLFEAVGGAKPFRPPAKGRSMIDALLRLADERRKDPASLFRDVTGIPAPLKSVIRRCLDPLPEHRYQSAEQLAADLQAVADDLPLIHAREPIVSQIGRGLRRNRRRLATAALVLVATAAVLGVYLNVQFERHDRYNEVNNLYRQGVAAIDRSEFKSASLLLDNAAFRASQPVRAPSRNLLRWQTLVNFPARLRKKLELLWVDPGLEELQGQIQIKAEMAKLIGTTRDQADELLKRSEDLRFRLIGLGVDLPGAVAELRQRLAPFYVLNSRQDWNELQHIWGLLDDKRAADLKHEVNELLFLWMVGVETSFRRSDPPVASRLADEPALIDSALQVCDRALTFAEPKEPWLAVRALLESHRASTVRPGDAPAGLPGHPGAVAASTLLPGEPAHVAPESSPTACFQWGLLCSSHGKPDRAIKWLQQAVWLEWSNYWYQFYLAYLQDQAGLTDDALEHYSAAVVRLPESPWVRFSRARLYRTKGRWSWALDDLRKARALMGQAPESLRVGLEIGLLHQALGSFGKAEAEYRAVITSAPRSEYARAARLNLANIDAESGREREALSAYQALLAERPDDASARFSRALMNIRLHRLDPAIGDLDLLMQGKIELSRSRPGEIQATRALANLLAGHSDAAASDAGAVMASWPSPANQRLHQRALLAAGRFDELQLERPEEIRLFPAGGSWLTANLKAAAKGLAAEGGSGPARYRGLLNRAVIDSALGDHRAALETADAALALAPLSSQVRLIRARVRAQAGDSKGALKEVEEGQKLQPQGAGFLELRGVALADEGNVRAGLAELDRSIAQSPNPFAYAAKARILSRAGDHDRAVYQWSLALRQDPAFPEAYLGRARCYVELRIWERALADLEQAATWAGGDLGLQSSIMLTYARCVSERPEYASRFWILLKRTTHQAWDQLSRASVADGLVR
jgi:serine/threonine protein kinase/predicted Zn-dependent protease